jgi:hypothetical protein
MGGPDALSNYLRERSVRLVAADFDWIVTNPLAADLRARTASDDSPVALEVQWLLQGDERLHEELSRLRNIEKAAAAAASSTSGSLAHVPVSASRRISPAGAPTAPPQRPRKPSSGHHRKSSFLTSPSVASTSSPRTPSVHSDLTSVRIASYMRPTTSHAAKNVRGVAMAARMR